MLGNDTVVDKVAIPTPYDFTFFTLPGDESSPIHLVSTLVADSIDETFFWIPSISTLITGDSVYGHTVHIWLADLLTPALTAAWLPTLDFIEHLAPQTIIPGHSLSTDNFGATIDLDHCRRYIQFFQNEIESKGPDFFTPQEIFDKLDGEFPSLLGLNVSQTSATLLNISSEEFGRGGARQVHYVDLAAYTNLTALEGWKVDMA